MRSSPAGDAVESGSVPAEPCPDADDPREHALRLAYRYLNRCERTVFEVQKHLLGKGLDAQSADQAITTLQQQGLLDDERFARVYMEDKRTLEQWGSERIRSSLLGRGIDRETVRAAIDGSPDESDGERALEVLRRRFPEPPRERRDRDRALGVLVRKGYEVEVALDALTRYARGDRSSRVP